MPPPRAWTAEAVRRIEADRARSADTHLLRMHFAGFPGVDIYFKDESTHPTGSLKHRLARSLFLCALCDGRLGPGQSVIDASSGSTAISEAYFARLLDLPYIAVMPRDTAPAKVREIEALGGRCDFVDDGCEVYARAAELTAQLGGIYLDQFTNAERATDWRGNNNIAESLIEQMRQEPHAVPDWIVCGAGTGGTSATIGPLPALPQAVDAAVRRRAGRQRVRRGVAGAVAHSRACAPVVHRGHRPLARRTVVRVRGRRSGYRSR
jgi:cysteine synthase A